MLCALTFLAWTASAQYIGYTAVTDQVAFRKQFVTGSSAVASITSEFTQEKTLAALTEKITSSGNFWFQRSNKVRLEYTHPFTYLVVMNGDKLVVRDQQKENRINVKSSRIFQQVNRIMIDCVQGTILDSKDFVTRVYESDRTWLLEMTPVAKALREFFKTVVLIVDKHDFTALSITLNEPQGDVSVLSFTRKKLNQPIPDAVFNP